MLIRGEWRLRDGIGSRVGKARWARILAITRGLRLESLVRGIALEAGGRGTLKMERGLEERGLWSQSQTFEVWIFPIGRRTAISVLSLALLTARQFVLPLHL